jgi:hypothetical protein
MSSIYSMKIVIDQDCFPELYAELSKARHPRARAQLLRQLAYQSVKQKGGAHTPPMKGDTGQSPVEARASQHSATTLSSADKLNPTAKRTYELDRPRYFVRYFVTLPLEVPNAAANQMGEKHSRPVFPSEYFE